MGYRLLSCIAAMGLLAQKIITTGEDKTQSNNPPMNCGKSGVGNTCPSSWTKTKIALEKLVNQGK